jgi:hypothetical protein
MNERTPLEDQKSLKPMEIAALFEKRSRQKKRLKALSEKVNAELTRLEALVLDLIVEGELPASFKGSGGASIYTREETWASPAEGNHERLTQVLIALGPEWAHLLPSNVNSQSLSGIVRKSYNEETQEFDLPPALLAALKITTKQRVVANG